jgi:hypothetical protein
MTYRAGVALIMMLVSVASCAGDSEPPRQTGGEPAVFFPVHHADDYPSAQGFGVLEEVGGCLLVNVDDAPKEMLPVWPEGFSFEDGTLYKDGSIVAAVGEHVKLEGGEIDEAVFEDLTGDTVPSSCSDTVLFMVGDAMRDGG